MLWDLEQGTIVTNESMDIVRSFDSAFDDIGNADVHFFPPERDEEIDAMIQANYQTINNGVYKCGFASSQQAHEDASRALFARLDELEEHLATRRYLLGDTVTAADWYLFPTLYRFDSVYYIHFKCSLKQLRDYPNLWGYTRDLYQLPGVTDTCHMDAIREHYFTSHESIHPRRYIPIGPVIDFAEPHNRA
jgi:putative glutathione S-transferase